MSIKATLFTPNQEEIAVISAALFSGLCRFPQLFVVVESTEQLAHGRYRFTVEEESTSSVQTPYLECVWHTLAIHLSGSSRHLLWFGTDPNCLEHVTAFGENDQGAQALIESRLGLDTVWQGINYIAQPIEALISQSETLEQLARRVARYTNDVFVLCPNQSHAEGWKMQWAHSAGALARAAAFKIDPDHCTVISRSTHRMEAALQRLSVPTTFGTDLRAVHSQTYLRQTHRPVQLGQLSADALTRGPALSEGGQPLDTLQTAWVEINRSEALKALWFGGAGALSRSLKRKRSESEEVNDQELKDEYLVVSSLFLYDNGSSSLSKARNILEEAVSCATQGASRDDQGWLACALTVPLEQMPVDKIVLESMIAQAAPESIWARMVASVGCAYPDLHAHSAPPLGPMMAIVANDPAGNDPIARTPDKSQYRTKIWVRPLGCDSDVLVDWATPFASEGGHGDLVLVPTANTLGFLLFQHGHGAPLFFATTHYRDVPVSKEIDPSAYKHGLVTDGGLVVHEVTKNSMVRAHVELRTKAANFKEIVGG